jgi:hypothetical protein
MFFISFSRTQALFAIKPKKSGKVTARRGRSRRLNQDRILRTIQISLNRTGGLMFDIRDGLAY